MTTLYQQSYLEAKEIAITTRRKNGKNVLGNAKVKNKLKPQI